MGVEVELGSGWGKGWGGGRGNGGRAGVERR